MVFARSQQNQRIYIQDTGSGAQGQAKEGSIWLTFSSASSSLEEHRRGRGEIRGTAGTQTLLKTSGRMRVVKAELIPSPKGFQKNNPKAFLSLEVCASAYLADRRGQVVVKHLRGVRGTGLETDTG